MTVTEEPTRRPRARRVVLAQDDGSVWTRGALIADVPGTPQPA